jgi:nitroreductase
MQTWDAITARRNVRSFTDRPIPAADLDRILMAMLLAAADLGIGSCHAGVADLPLARELLGLPQDRDWALLISLGYPADRPLTPVRQPKRRPFGQVVHYGRW